MGELDASHRELVEQYRVRKARYEDDLRAWRAAADAVEKHNQNAESKLFYALPVTILLALVTAVWAFVARGFVWGFWAVVLGFVVFVAVGLAVDVISDSRRRPLPRRPAEPEEPVERSLQEQRNRPRSSADLSAAHLESLPPRRTTSAAISCSCDPSDPWWETKMGSYGRNGWHRWGCSNRR